MAEGHLPNFKRFYEASHVFVTETDETDPVNLEPWIQWYTVHTGLSYQQHKVFNLTDRPRAPHKDIWQTLIENGKTVANCSSMNARKCEAPGSLFIPDPWCTSETAYPDELNAFHRVVSDRVQEYSNEDAPLKLGDFVKFVGFIATHGLRPGTVNTIVRQLISEAVTGKATYWKRAPILDRLQLDVFLHYWRRLRPDFSTFFVNSVAHFQHAYWRHMQPEAFTHQPSPEELRSFHGAVLHGYKCQDHLLGDFFGLEKDGVTLVLASALSQKPFLRLEGSGGQHFYRPRDIASLLAKLGIRPRDVQPVMTHQYMMRLDNSEQRAQARDVLARIKLDGEPIIDMRDVDQADLYFGNRIAHQVPEDARITFGGSNADEPFADFFYKIADMKSGCHDPDGVLWVKTGEHRVHDGKTSILNIFPTLLDFFGIDPASVSGETYAGHSLLPVIDGRELESAA